MNERIKELAEQAKFETTTMTHAIDGEKQIFYGDAAIIQKFAELIVNDLLSELRVDRDAYRATRDFGADPGTYKYEEFYAKYDAKASAIEDAIEDIKEQFGVEE